MLCESKLFKVLDSHKFWLCQISREWWVGEKKCSSISALIAKGFVVWFAMGSKKNNDSERAVGMEK